jgi:hypothetical protein
MDLKPLRKRCEARLLQLDFSGCTDAASFCRSLAVHRSRPILLRPIAGWTGPCGLWIAAGSADIIFYEQETSSLHQDHIILHEASHLLCDHVSAELPVSALPLLLFPDLRPEAVWQVLQRATYGAHQEQEAELLASLIRERLVPELPPVGPVHDARTAGVLGRLGTSLEEDHGAGM